MKKFFPEINIARGILVFLVVFAHVISQFAWQDGDSVMAHIFRWIYSFHIPAFVLIAGFCAAKLLDMNTNAEYKGYLSTRCKRLMIPYFAWGGVYFVLRFVMGSSAREQYDMSRAWQFLLGYNPDGAMWFMWTLFVALIVVVMQLRFGVNTALFISSICYILCKLLIVDCQLHAVASVPTFVFFFMLGLYIRQNYQRLSKLIYSWRALAIAAVVFSAANIIRLPILPAVAGSILVLQVGHLLARRGNVAIMMMSAYAMEIYILAEPVKVVMRMAFFKLGIQPSIAFTGMLIVCITIPILVKKCFISKVIWLDRILLGNRWR